MELYFGTELMYISLALVSCTWMHNAGMSIRSDCNVHSYPKPMSSRMIILSLVSRLISACRHLIS